MATPCANDKVFSLKKSHLVTVDWSAFLGRHDLVWEQLPQQWNEGAFVGNGQVGMMIYAQPDNNRIDFHVGRRNVTDHRGAPDRKTSMGVLGADVMYDFPRLDVGRMALRPAGKILSGAVRQNPWDAEVRGTVVTDLGEIRFRAFTPCDRMVNVVEVESTEKTPQGKRAPWQWEFLPGNPPAPAAQIYPTRKESLAGEPCRLKVPDWTGEIHAGDRRRNRCPVQAEPRPTGSRDKPGCSRPRSAQRLWRKKGEGASRRAVLAGMRVCTIGVPSAQHTHDCSINLAATNQSPT